MPKLVGRVVIVTGGASGIGKATAKLAAQEGAKVAVCDIDDENGRQTVNEIRQFGLNATFFHVDVSKEGEVKETFRRISEELGLIYGLVNNAGVQGDNKLTHELDEADWDRVLAVDVKGVFFCTKYAIPDMIKNDKGSIVNISSTYGLVGEADVPSYHAAKAAVTIMAKVDAISYGKQNIRVNSVHPGIISTPLLTRYLKSLGDKEATTRDQLVSKQPLARIGQPEEVASGIIFLLSDEASFITGSALIIDGGYTSW